MHATRRTETLENKTVQKQTIRLLHAPLAGTVEIVYGTVHSSDPVRHSILYRLRTMQKLNAFSRIVSI